MSKDIAKVVTDRIIDALKEGIVPWAKPWASVGAPQSVEGRRYRGINVLLLTLASMTEGYSSPYWVTFNQAKARGWKLVDAKGKGVNIVLWKPIRSIQTDEETGEERESSFMFMRYFTVFNLDLVEVPEGCEIAKPKVVEPLGFNPVAEAQSIIEMMPQAPPISHGGDMAFYNATTDEVRLPIQGAFDTESDYYAVAYHELAHATGHGTRLDRPTLTSQGMWGDQTYAKEELVAELCSAMLCGEAGLTPNYVRSAAYVRSWTKWAEDNRREIISAAGQAQKAADFILGSTENGSAPESEEG